MISALPVHCQERFRDRRIFEIGAVLEHVCQLLVPKVVESGVILEVSQGLLLEVSLGSIWRCLGGGFGGILEVILGSHEHLGGQFGACGGLSESVWHSLANS